MPATPANICMFSWWSTPFLRKTFNLIKLSCHLNDVSYALNELNVIRWGHLWTFYCKALVELPILDREILGAQGYVKPWSLRLSSGIWGRHVLHGTAFAKALITSKRTCSLSPLVTFLHVSSILLSNFPFSTFHPLLPSTYEDERKLPKLFSSENILRIWTLRID